MSVKSLSSSLGEKNYSIKSLYQWLKDSEISSNGVCYINWNYSILRHLTVLHRIALFFYISS